MNKWTSAAKRRKEEIDNRDAMAADLTALLEALPQGVKKQLEKDEVCGAIIEKYIGEVN